MPSDYLLDPSLSRGAKLARHMLAAMRPSKGGIRHCGRSKLASRLRCSTRQVSRYVRELREAGYVDVVPPRRERRPEGWRSVGVNGYLLTPRYSHRRSSRRGDTYVIPPRKLGRGSAHTPADPAPTPSPPPFAGVSDAPDGPTPDYLAARAALRKANQRWRRR